MTRFLKPVFLHMYIDFHTHHPATGGTLAIQDGVQTWGVHPWYVSADALLSVPADIAGRLAIGECGLDRLATAPQDVQEHFFKEQILLSEQYCKPLFVHCVRMLDDVLRLHGEMNVTQPWIMHGFRGKPRQMQSILSAGMYVSFGFHFHAESLLMCPLDRLLLETDDEEQPISDLYAEVASLLHMEVSELCRQMEENYKTLFSW